MDYTGIIFLTTMPLLQLGESVSPPLLQIYTSTAWKLLFNAGENVQTLVVVCGMIVFYS
jgi:hypothetical protein